ncbi:hypothetical protein CEXT_682021 [Caerostris extrusa]|uniref:Uncharacterized protein n=1 Tax=Caerostris extrusa TaxID=172846 RepID=A0AAV4UF88_CAEEX|nr:hypothetical protein CEXT_682021 [Caerostris extrusa]
MRLVNLSSSKMGKQNAVKSTNQYRIRIPLEPLKDGHSMDPKEKDILGSCGKRGSAYYGPMPTEAQSCECELHQYFRKKCNSDSSRQRECRDSRTATPAGERKYW